MTRGFVFKIRIGRVRLRAELSGCWLAVGVEVVDT